MTLDELITLGEAQAQAVLLGTKEQMSPSWLLVGLDGQRHLFMTPWKSDFEKELTRSFMREKMKELDAVAYSVVTESWMVRLPNGARPIVDRPSQDPRRQECVMIMATDGVNYETKTLLIVRDRATGNCNGLPEFNDLGGSKEESVMKSPFLNLLK